MKRISVLLLAIIMLIILADCGGKTNRNIQATVDSIVKLTQTAISENYSLPAMTTEIVIQNSEMPNITPIAIPTVSNSSRPATSFPVASPTVSVSTQPINSFPIQNHKNIYGSGLIGIPISSTVGEDNSYREGYRLDTVFFYVNNPSIDPLVFDNSYLNPLLVKIKAVDSKGYEYECAAGIQVNLDNIFLPTDVYVPYAASCGVPNNAKDVSVVFVDKKFNEPLTVKVGSTTGQIINYVNLPTIAELVKNYPGIGSTNSVENFTDITLISADYDNANTSWGIKLQITNQYGHDLSPGRFVFLYTLSDKIMSGKIIGWDNSNNNIPLDIPPGSEATWEFTILGGEPSKTLLEIMLFTDHGFPYMIFGLQ